MTMRPEEPEGNHMEERHPDRPEDRHPDGHPDCYAERYAEEYPCREDEIDLVDLARVTWRRKWLLIGFTLLCTAAGVVYALITPPVYRYTTSLQPVCIVLPSEEGGLEPTLVEPIADSANLLKNVLLPRVVRQVKDRVGEDQPVPEVEVDTGGRREDLQVIMLHSEAPEELAERVEMLHRGAMEALAKHLDHRVEDFRAEQELARERLQNRLDTLENKAVFATKRYAITAKIDRLKQQEQENTVQLAVLRERQKKLDEKETYIKERIEAERVYLSTAEANRQQAAHQANSESQVMTLLMIDNQLEQARQRLTSFENNLFFSLPEQRQELDKEILAINLANERIGREIADLNNKLVAMELEHGQEIEEVKRGMQVIDLKIRQTNLTSASGLAERSLEPLKPKKKLVVAVAGAAGIFGGLVLIFLAEFIAAVRTRLREEGVS
jgi:capsular polysaccharide biosynthesis protein